MNAIALSMWMNKSTDARLKTSHTDYAAFVEAPRMTGQTNVRGGRECVMSAHKEKKKNWDSVS